jgi:hypothetical protein
MVVAGAAAFVCPCLLLVVLGQFREERMELYHRVTVARDTGLDRLASLDQDNAQLAAQLEDLKVATKTQVSQRVHPRRLRHVRRTRAGAGQRSGKTTNLFIAQRSAGHAAAKCGTR